MTYQKKYTNPFFKKKKNNRISDFISQLSLRIKFMALLITIFAISLIWFYFFSSVFTIKSIIVNPTDNTSGAKNIKEIEDIARKQLNDSRFFIGSQKNLNLFNKDELIRHLNKKYYFENIIIKKQSPNVLVIKIKKTTYSVIWLEADKYYYADSEGHIIDEIDALKAKYIEYPLIDNRGEARIFNRNIEGASYISYIISLFKEFKNNQYNFDVERFIIDDDANVVKMVLKEGPEIYFSAKEGIDKQVSKLSAVMSKDIKDDFNDKFYIDLRYGDKVYYK